MNLGRGPIRRRLRPSPNPIAPAGYRISRRGNLVPLAPLNRPPLVNVSRPRRRRPRRFQNSRNPNIPNLSNPRSTGTRGRADNLTISKQEFWFSVEPGVHKYIMKIGESGVPHLDRFGQIHESAQIRHFKVFFRPSAGTTIAGNITMGVDYQPENDRKPEDIKILDTNVSGTIYSQSSMNLIVNRLQKNVSWLGTAASANPHSYFALYVDAQTEASSIGQIWVSYRVAFSDPTSPSGVAVNKQVVSIVSGNLTSDAMNETPAQIDISSGGSLPIQVLEPTHAIKTDPTDGTTYQTKIGIDPDIEVSTVFTVGSAHSVPESNAAHSYRASAPKINFKYSDGTPIPDGTIVPLQTFAPVQYSSGGMQSDIFASIFKILKPLAKPVWGFLDQLVQPLISYSEDKGDDAKLSITDPVDYPSDQLTSFTFLGEEATITVPVTDKDAITSRFPVTIMQSLGHGWPATHKNYVAVYSHNLISHPTSWLASVDDGGGTGYNTILKTVFRHPNENTPAFQNGDLVVIFVSTVPIERGIGKDVHTPFAAPFDDNHITTIISKLENSTLSNTDATDPDAPRLKILDHTNLSEDTRPGRTVGAWFTGRFVSTFSDSKYLKAVITFPIGATVGGVDTSASLSMADEAIVRTVFHKPDYNYNMALGFLTFQFFPTATEKLAVSSSPTSFSISRIRDDFSDEE